MRDEEVLVLDKVNILRNETFPRTVDFENHLHACFQDIDSILDHIAQALSGWRATVRLEHLILEH